LKIVFLVAFFSKNAQFGAGNSPFWSNLAAKLKFRTLVISSAAVCWKMATSCRASCLTNDRIGLYDDVMGVQMWMKEAAA